MSAGTAAPSEVRLPPAGAAAVRPDARGGAGRWIGVVGPGWPPAVLLTVAVVMALRHFQVPVATSLTFLAYLIGCVVLPGLLVWRACSPGSPRMFVEEVFAGLAVGYAIETLSYLPARACGMPRLAILGPILTVAAFVAVPGLRRHWRTPAPGRAPGWWSWTTTLCVAIVLVWSFAIVSMRGLDWPQWALVDMDSPFHLSLLGELRHHLPPHVPYLSQEPLVYHWFVYAEMAATSWATGIEPELLLYRLSMVPMIVALPVLTAILGRRLTGRWWPGIVAIGIGHCLVAPNPYGWRLDPAHFANGQAIIEDISIMRQALWTSPTQNFGATLFMPLVIVVIDLLRSKRPSPARWFLCVLLVIATTNTKATFLPLLLAGLCLVVAVCRVVRRRWNAPALVLAGLVLSCLLFAQVVIYRGVSGGLNWDPMHSVHYSLLSYVTGVARSSADVRPALLLVLVITLFCWACTWFGVLGLVVRRALLRPEYVLLLGIGLPALAILLLFAHPGGSHGFFLMSARPYLGVAAAAGLALAIPAGRHTRRTGAVLVAAAMLGVAVVVGIRAVAHPVTPAIGRTHDQRALVWSLALPYLLLTACLVGVAVAVWVARRRVSVLRGIAVAAVIAMVAGFGVPSVYDQVRGNVLDSMRRDWVWGQPGPPAIPRGTKDAARWLRAHSSPDDVVATNAHCLPLPDPALCDNRRFWFAAYSERRFLVESWGYTARAHQESRALGVSDAVVPFWDKALLAANDAVFTAPSAATVALLRTRYGVRWLFVDEQVPPSPALADVARLRFRAADCAIYELVD